jgi:hypothetical protein
MSLGDNMEDANEKMQERAQAKISPSEPWPEMTKHGVAEAYLQVKAMNDRLTTGVKWPGQKPNIGLNHSEFVLQRRKNELEKAEVAWREARAAFDKLKRNCMERRQKQLDLIRETASDILEGFSIDDFQLSPKADVEEVEGGCWVSCRVWVSK